MVMDPDMRIVPLFSAAPPSGAVSPSSAQGGSLRTGNQAPGCATCQPDGVGEAQVASTQAVTASTAWLAGLNGAAEFTGSVDLDEPPGLAPHPARPSYLQWARSMMMFVQTSAKPEKYCKVTSISISTDDEADNPEVEADPNGGDSGEGDKGADGDKGKKGEAKKAFPQKLGSAGPMKEGSNVRIGASLAVVYEVEKKGLAECEFWNTIRKQTYTDPSGKTTTYEYSPPKIDWATGSMTTISTVTKTVTLKSGLSGSKPTGKETETSKTPAYTNQGTGDDAGKFRVYDKPGPAFEGASVFPKSKTPSISLPIEGPQVAGEYTAEGEYTAHGKGTDGVEKTLDYSVKTSYTMDEWGIIPLSSIKSTVSVSKAGVTTKK